MNNFYGILVKYLYINLDYITTNKKREFIFVISLYILLNVNIHCNNFINFKLFHINYFASLK